jgi:hypothetical protein
MEANFAQYFDNRGAAVLAYEHPLRELGLIVHKTPVAGFRVPAGHTGSLYDLAFERRDEKFSPELIRLLENESHLSAEDIRWVEEHSTYRGTAA